MVRLAGTAEFARDLLDGDQQAALSVAFLETGAALVAALRGGGWRVDTINGSRPVT